MNFYTQIAKHYDKIFPVTKEQITFIEGHLEGASKTLLDIACGDGGHAIELAKLGYIVTALDATEEMIQNAKEKAELQGVEIATLTCGMEVFEKQITGQFDGVICIGNSLVHLKDLEQVADFFRQVKGVLRPEGKAILQIVNYDRILKDNVKALPTIENSDYPLKFERFYEYNQEKNTLRFHTKLHVKENITEHTVELLPLLSGQIRQLVAQAGLKITHEYGAYNGTAYQENESFHYIITIEK